MKALIVEDNRKLAELLVRAFSEEGWVVDRVGDGVSALEQIEGIPYDLVVLDWMLPRMDGLAVSRELRARGARVPILMLTARGDLSERIVGLDAGADDYLVKPFDLGELMARARALVRRASNAGGVVRVGPLSIDLLRRLVVVAGAPVDLTSREFTLLAHLAQSAGRVVTRTEIFAKVWGAAADAGSNVIDVHVKRIRDKLGAHAELLETVRGVGFRLIAPP
ncbi:MAG TPA: response regulator transcription factor [Polyangiaceae bacterium]|nr:response regulator transcription factor [Polyangiaceae bacterium]